MVGVGVDVVRRRAEALKIPSAAAARATIVVMSRDACIALAHELGLDVDPVVERWAERAAIREYEGLQPRADAERDAVADLRAIYASTLVTGARRGPQSAAATEDAARSRSAKR